MMPALVAEQHDTFLISSFLGSRSFGSVDRFAGMTQDSINSTAGVNPSRSSDSSVP